MIVAETAVGGLRPGRRLVRVDRIRRVLADQSIDRLADQVSVTDVPSALLDDVHEQPPEAERKFHHTGSKQLHHPIAGDLNLAYEARELPADHGQRILVYTAEPASPSDDALKLLATWSATTPLAEPHADATH